MANLPLEALKRWVIAASAGNHAQGVALSAQNEVQSCNRDAGNHS
jgi:threonine dehydratase